MAEGRLIKKRISRSRKFAALKSDRARMLYLTIYPHLDIEGRIEADPILIKHICLSRLTITFPEIQESLEDIHAVGLGILYTIGNDQFLQVARFKDFQRLDPKREAKSQIPPPPIRPILKRRCFTKYEYEQTWLKWEKEDLFCPLCGKKAEMVPGRGYVVDGHIPFQIDHKLPLSKGGTYDLDNLWVICQRCNVQGDKVLPELLQSNFKEPTPENSGVTLEDSCYKLSKDKVKISKGKDKEKNPAPPALPSHFWEKFSQETQAKLKQAHKTTPSLYAMLNLNREPFTPIEQFKYKSGMSLLENLITKVMDSYLRNAGKLSGKNHWPWIQKAFLNQLGEACGQAQQIKKKEYEAKTDPQLIGNIMAKLAAKGAIKAPNLTEGVVR